ncbi:kinase-like protein [Amylocystis lapponica]|nr:kinase-like protein [Amylocystis lapponica]
MSHALLLRLFLSPSFFSVHVALQYLRVYADNIGITYYLTRRLRELDTQELREVWGFICHLLVTRPSRSRALECFVVEVAQKSTHIAMLTLWFMQASLKDLSLPSHNPQSFLICQRVLHQCHEIIFGDLPVRSSAPYSSLNLPAQVGPPRRRVKPQVQSALVGIGMVWAGVPGLPQLTDVMGEVAIEQGRIDEQGQDLRSLERTEDGAIIRVIPPAPSTERPDERDDSDDSDDSEKAEDPAGKQQNSSQHPESIIAARRLGMRRQTFAARTTPALPLHLKDVRKYRLSEDPFGQQDAPLPATTPFQSTPSFSVTRHSRRMSSTTAADIIMQKYDFQSQVQLLRANYCRTEIKFLITLENISNRLLVVPRPARVSALRAELTGLNHMLPAEVCMPMWCSSSDTPTSHQGIPQAHHRIVRIPPGESVVLNSAERAPYLLLIEILHGDLDFDPSKRSNKEILQEKVIKEDAREGSKDLTPFTPSLGTPRRSLMHAEPVNGLEATLGTDAADADEPPLVVVTGFSSGPISPTLSDDDEEIDLVEQVYGTENSFRGREVDLSESIVLPPPPKNRELDMATWSRSSSVPQTPMVDKEPASPHTPAHSLSLPFPLSRQTSTSPSNHSDSSFNGNAMSSPRMLSMDEYSERMRTAAIMLAQLNANLVREPVTTIGPPGTPLPAPESTLVSSFRWLPGGSWLAGAPVTTTPTAGSWGDSSAPPQTPASVPLRIKLQYSEAAAIRERIMSEMLALEEERMARMRENGATETTLRVGMGSGDGSMKTAEDEGIIRRELSKVDPSAVVFSESWAAKKSRIRQASPYGHLANWDCVSVIVKTGGDLRQEQLAVQLIKEFENIWKEENCPCWVRYFRILITGNSSGLVETITDAVSIHSIKKAEYARRLAEGRFGHITLFDHFRTTYGDPSSAKFARAQRNFAKSLAGYSLVTYFLQIKDRHNGNILLDRDGHLIHIDFGFMLSNSPGNLGFEAAPFKLPLEYIEVLGGVESKPFHEFKRLFREGFDAMRKHCDRIITLVELMQKDSALPCFAALGEQTAAQLRERFQQGLTQATLEEHVDRLIDTSLGSSWTRLYDSYQYYSQSIL